MLYAAPGARRQFKANIFCVASLCPIKSYLRANALICKIPSPCHTIWTFLPWLCRSYEQNRDDRGLVFSCRLCTYPVAVHHAELGFATSRPTSRNDVHSSKIRISFQWSFGSVRIGNGLGRHSFGLYLCLRTVVDPIHPQVDIATLERSFLLSFEQTNPKSQPLPPPSHAMLRVGKH